MEAVSATGYAGSLSLEISTISFAPVPRAMSRSTGSARWSFYRPVARTLRKVARPAPRLPPRPRSRHRVHRICSRRPRRGRACEALWRTGIPQRRRAQVKAGHALDARLDQSGAQQRQGGLRAFLPAHPWTVGLRPGAERRDSTATLIGPRNSRHALPSGGRSRRTGNPGGARPGGSLLYFVDPKSRLVASGTSISPRPSPPPPRAGREGGGAG